MPTVEFSDAAYEKLAFAAKVAGVTLTEAVDRVFATFNSPITSPDCGHTPSVPEGHQDEIKVTATYLGRRVTGYLDLDSERLRITEAPDSHLVRSFKSPSQAAVETVRHLNPSRKRPETNGWRFFCAEDGQLIERYRRR